MENGIFIDWLTVWQNHSPHVPINTGAIVTYDGRGSPVFETIRPTRVRGSYDTSCVFKSDGSTAFASGNFGRFSRKDNLFGFGPAEALQRLNSIASFVGLPLFEDQRDRKSSPSSFLRIAESSGSQSPELRSASPLRLSRVDITRNYQCGSLAAARAAIRAISAKCLSRVKKGVAGDESVWWSNTRYMLKVYVKALEMEAHHQDVGKVYEYARDNGIIRLELELKRRTLGELGWNDYSDFSKAWQNGDVAKLFAEYEKILEVAAMNNDIQFLDSIPQRLRVVAAAFLSGRDVRPLVSRATFYRYRAALLEYGIDISDESPAQLSTVVRKIEIVPVTAPDWYWKEAA